MADKKKFSKEEVEAALNLLHREYFMQVSAVCSYTDLKELTFTKCPIQTPSGGLYLVSILHIDGPKLSLDALAEASGEVNDESKD